MWLGLWLEDQLREADFVLVGGVGLDVCVGLTLKLPDKTLVLEGVLEVDQEADTVGVRLNVGDGEEVRDVLGELVRSGVGVQEWLWVGVRRTDPVVETEALAVDEMVRDEVGLGLTVREEETLREALREGDRAWVGLRLPDAEAVGVPVRGAVRLREAVWDAVAATVWLRVRDRDGVPEREKVAVRVAVEAVGLEVGVSEAEGPVGPRALSGVTIKWGNHAGGQGEGCGKNS